MSNPWEDDSAESKPTSGKGKVFIIIAAILVLLLSLLFFLNNRTTNSDIAKISSKELDSLNDLTFSEKKSLPKKDSINPKKTVINTVSTAKKQIVEISRIKCRLHYSDPIDIFISLKIYINSKLNKKDILLRRNEIIVKVQQIMSTKQISQIKVKEIRAELINDIDAYLGGGIIEDIEFTDFRPVELVE